jgi:hypothetical protein
MRRGKTQITKIRNKKGEITTNNKEIQEILNVVDVVTVEERVNQS